MGRTIFQSGNVHEGEYVDDKRHGWGRFIWSDGAYYDGYWLNGMRSGQGKFVHADGKIEEGIWNAGEMQLPEEDGSPGSNGLVLQPQKDILVDPNSLPNQFDAMNPSYQANYANNRQET